MRIDETDPDTLDPGVLDRADAADVAEQRAETDDDAPDAGLDELPLEADAADVAEQRAELDDDAPDGGGLDELPLEADPADVAEQDRAVLYDDER